MGLSNMNLIVIEAHFFFKIYLNEYLTINYVSASFVHTNRETRYFPGRGGDISTLARSPSSEGFKI